LPFPQTFHAWIGWNVTLPALESLHDREKYINKIKKHGMLQAGSIPFFLFGFMKKNRRSSQSAVRSAAAVGKGRGEIQKIYGFSKKRMVFFQEYVIIDIIRSGAQNRIRRVCHEIPKCKKRYPQYFSLRDHHAVL
ncbi:MAG: hypothetical protein II127_00035, partial [Ruminococcus sp.]|nr:hypothetical protein [Ruminococcus sp.]